MPPIAVNDDDVTAFAVAMTGAMRRREIYLIGRLELVDLAGLAGEASLTNGPRITRLREVIAAGIAAVLAAREGR